MGALQGNKRFGAYLRQLREERHFTLDNIEEISLTHKLRISKAYLCRLENGVTAPNIKRLSVLSKIYNVDLGRLVERHEIENELADIPPIDLTGVSFDDLHARGVEQADHGNLKAAFAQFNAAHDLAMLEEGEEANLRRVKARLSLSIVLRHMGKYELACDEANQITKQVRVSPSLMNKVLLQIAVCHQALGRFHLAQILVEGLERRRATLSIKDQADLLLMMGRSEYFLGSLGEAIKRARVAASLYRKTRDRLGESKALHNAGFYYLAKGQSNKGIEFFEKGLGLARRVDFKREISLQLSDLAKALIAAGLKGRARTAIHESMELARNGEYHDVLFSNYFHLWRLNQESGDEAGASTALRSLNKLLPKVEETLEEVAEFRRLTERTKQ